MGLKLLSHIYIVNSNNPLKQEIRQMAMRQLMVMFKKLS